MVGNPRPSRLCGRKERKYKRGEKIASTDTVPGGMSYCDKLVNEKGVITCIAPFWLKYDTIQNQVEVCLSKWGVG